MLQNATYADRKLVWAVVASNLTIWAIIILAAHFWLHWP